MITDNNGITKTSATYTIVQPDILSVSITTTPLACNADSTGIATAVITGGTQPYSYNWSTGDTTTAISQLTEGGYFVFVTDSNACKAQQEANVTAPTGMVIDTVVQQPTCNGSCNGSIQLIVTGGAGGYVYQWNTGATTASLAGLCAGTYKVSIKDQNNCTAYRTFILSDPGMLQIHAGQNTTLCNGQQYQADATINDPTAVYQWGSDHGFTSVTPQVSLSDTGNYWVQVTDSRGCTGTDSFALHHIDMVIASDFVVSTQVFAEQPVSIVNISDPTPDSIAWIIPDIPSIVVTGKSAVSANLQFNDTGSYTIGLKAYLGPCWKLTTQKIVVLEAQSFEDPGAVNDPLIRAFTIAPNPSQGNFTVHILLSESARIRIRMINLLTNFIVDDRQANGNSQYDISYSFNNITAGIYFLVLETAKGNSVYKLVIL
jgi:hypothetical protein